jgi:hypothetical protein
VVTLTTNGFEKMKSALQAEGWFVGWNLPCCQSCAWSEVPYEHEEGPFEGQEVDFSKVLFNHSQDCEVYVDDEECEMCDGEGMIEVDSDDDDDDDWMDCTECSGSGYIMEEGSLDYEPDTSVDGFICMPPEIAKSSVFCYDGTKEGVQNLKDVLQLIEDCGCTVNWSGSGDSRIEISW